jgi:hyperosmotically inducible periplasmic protein
MKKLTIRIALLMGFAISATLAQQSDSKPDNSRENKRDRRADEPTADQQKMNSADQALTRKIRQSIMADKSLSTYAHNIKIIAQDGKVTMKGPVRSEAEKRIVMAKAVKVSGHPDKVTDQISVAPEK